MVELLKMIVFFGSSKHSIPVLKALLRTNWKLTVVTTPDKPAGRHQQLTPNSLAVFAASHNLTILKLMELNSKSLTVNSLKSQSPVLGICCVYGKIIPKQWLNFFPKGILNIHPSLLPKYRGSSPAQFAILNNEKTTGVSIIKMDEKCDHGPIIKQIKEKILPNDTAESLYNRLFSLAASTLPQIINDYLNNDIKPAPQNHCLATFTRLLTKKDGFISEKILQKAMLGNTPSAEMVDRKRRAFTPWPGIYTKIQVGSRGEKKEKILKILETHLEKKKLIIDRVQLEGKRPVTFSQFSCAYHWL